MYQTVFGMATIKLGGRLFIYTGASTRLGSVRCFKEVLARCSTDVFGFFHTAASVR